MALEPTFSCDEDLCVEWEPARIVDADPEKVKRWVTIVTRTWTPVPEEFIAAARAEGNIGQITAHNIENHTFCCAQHAIYWLEKHLVNGDGT